MKKLLITLLAVLSVFACAFALSACGGAPEASALEKAYSAYLATPNMTVTVTDSRTQKHGIDLSVVAEIDHGHKAVHLTDYTGESYEQIICENGAISGNRYFYAQHLSSWQKEPVSFPPDSTGKSDESLEIEYLCNAAGNHLPAYRPNSMAFCEHEDDDTVSSSLQWILNLFAENEGVYTANLYACIMGIGESEYARFACTVTVKLNGQGRFEEVVMDFGENGKITSVYTYGTANVTVPC